MDTYYIINHNTKKTLLFDFFIIIFILLPTINCFAQDQEQDYFEQEIENSKKIKNIDTLSTSSFFLEDRKPKFISNKKYIYSTPYNLRIYNSNKDFSVLQLGKLKYKNPFLFIKIFSYNVCLKKDYILEFRFINGKTIRIKNKYQSNCQGHIVSKLKNKIIKKLIKDKISSIMILSFKKDLELRLNTEEAQRFQYELTEINNIKL